MDELEKKQLAEAASTLPTISRSERVGAGVFSGAPSAHLTVLAEAAVEHLVTNPDGHYVDATFVVVVIRD